MRTERRVSHRSRGTLEPTTTTIKTTHRHIRRWWLADCWLMTIVRIASHRFHGHVLTTTGTPTDTGWAHTKVRNNIYFSVLKHFAFYLRSWFQFVRTAARQARQTQPRLIGFARKHTPVRKVVWANIDDNGQDSLMVVPIRVGDSVVVCWKFARLKTTLGSFPTYSFNGRSRCHKSGEVTSCVIEFDIIYGVGIHMFWHATRWNQNYY